MEGKSFLVLLIFFAIACDRKLFMGDSYFYYDIEYSLEVKEAFHDRSSFILVPKTGNLMYILPNDVSRLTGKEFKLSNRFSKDFLVYKPKSDTKLLFVDSNDTLEINFDLLPWKNRFVLGVSLND
jgi:hypothetical protein